MAIDFQYLNFFIVFDTEPTSSLEGDLHKFPGATYFQSLTCAKPTIRSP